MSNRDSPGQGSHNDQNQDNPPQDSSSENPPRTRGRRTRKNTVASRARSNSATSSPSAPKRARTSTMVNDSQQPGTSNDDQLPPSDGGGLGRLHTITPQTVSSVVPAAEIQTVEELVRRMTTDIMEEFRRTDKFASWHDDMKSFAAAIEYVGLDVVNMRRALVWYAKQLDPENFQRPLMIAVISGLKRGNNVDRMRESVQDGAKALLSRVINGLRIESKTNKKPNTITLARIMVCFPEYAAMVSTVIQSPGPVDDMPAEYPWCMRNGSFSGLIPRMPRAGNPGDANIIETLKRAHTVYQARTSLILDRKVKSITKTLIDRQRTFVNTGISSGTATDDLRWELLEDSFFGVIVNGQISAAVTQLSSAIGQYTD